MPFPRSFLRHTMIWSLPGGEVANVGCAWDNEGGGVLDITTDLINAFTARQDAFWDDIKSQYSTDMSFAGGRLALISVNGTTVETANLASTLESGSVGQTSLPSEVAVVASLITGLQSRRGRGRMYLPAPTVTSVSNGGRVLPASQVAIADSMDVYLASININGTLYFPVVASVAGQLLTRVTQVRVGNVYDAQRRRRDNLIEVLETRNV